MSRGEGQFYSSVFLIVYLTSPDTALHLHLRTCGQIAWKIQQICFSLTPLFSCSSDWQSLKELILIPSLECTFAHRKQEPGTPASPTHSDCCSTDWQSLVSAEVPLNWVPSVSGDKRCSILEKWCLRSPRHPPQYLMQTRQCFLPPLKCLSWLT